MFHADAGKHTYFKRDEAVRKYRNLKASDAHWLKVQQEGGKNNVHVDFVAPSSTKAIRRSNTTMVKLSIDDGLQRPALAESDAKDAGLGVRRASQTRRSSGTSQQGKSLSPQEAPDTWRGDEEQARRHPSLRTRKDRKRACALCEHEFPENVMGSEQLRSSILQLRRIFAEIQAREQEPRDVNLFTTAVSSPALLKSSSEAPHAALSPDKASGSQEIVRFSSRGDSPEAAISSMIEKYRYSRMYDKVRVCLFCSQFFPYENFRKAAGRHRRGAKVKPNAVDDIGELNHSLGPLQARAEFQARAPTFRPQRQSAVSAWRMQKIRVKRSKEREAQLAAIGELHHVLDVVEKGLKRGGAGGKVKGPRRDLETALQSFVSVVDTKESPWVPGGHCIAKVRPITRSAQNACRPGRGAPGTKTGKLKKSKKKSKAKKLRRGRDACEDLDIRHEGDRDASMKGKREESSIARGEGVDGDYDDDNDEEEAWRIAREEHAAAFARVKRAIHAAWLAKQRARENKQSTFRPNSISAHEKCLVDEVQFEMRRLDATRRGSALESCPET